MTEVAGEVADALLCHGFTTERYIREVTLPSLARGMAASGQAREIEISVMPFIVTGLDEREFRAAADAARQQLAFYASTPAYRPVLELHGWEAIQTDLRAKASEGKWDEMAVAISDEMLTAFAVVGEPHEIGPMLVQRFGDVAGRIVVHAPEHGIPALAPAVSHLVAR